MLRSIIVDDEFKSRESLKSLINSFCEGVQVEALCQNVAEGLEAIATYKPDILFLDVQMQRETGFDLLSQLKSIDFEVIFTTAHSEYAIKAIKFSAIDYLLKPIDVEDLRAAIAKVSQKQNGRIEERLKFLLSNLKATTPSNYKLALPTANGLSFIKVTDILYCKASGNYTEIFTQDGVKHLISRHLKEYDDLLAEYDFFRIHHSYLININCIKSYVRGEGGYVIMSDDATLDVSRRKKEAFLDRIGYRG